jgi:hypothetical protein
MMGAVGGEERVGVMGLVGVVRRDIVVEWVALLYAAMLSI